MPFTSSTKKLEDFVSRFDKIKKRTQKIFDMEKQICMLKEITETLEEINNLPDLRKDNIIEEIKTRLKDKNLGEYTQWKEKNFDTSCNFKDDKEKIIFIAAHNGYKNIVTSLLDNGVDVNTKDKDGYTLLHWAIRSISIENVVKAPVVKVLLEKKAKVDDDIKEEVIQLSEQAEKEQLKKNAIAIGVVVGIVTALVVDAALSIPAIIGITAGSTLIVGGVTGVGKYTMSKPDTKMKENNLENLGSANMQTLPPFQLINSCLLCTTVVI